jgi:hypothetical protein
MYFSLTGRIWEGGIDVKLWISLGAISIKKYLCRVRRKTTNEMTAYNARIFEDYFERRNILDYSTN